MLQNRGYCVEDRLIILGMFCNEINKNDNIISTIETFKNRLLNNTYRTILNEINYGLNINVKLNILKQIIDARIEGLDSGDFLEFYNKSMEGLRYNKNAIIHDVVKTYNLSYKNYYKKFMLNREYIIENFLVNYVFQNTFPIGNKKIFDEYIILAVYYFIIKIHLVGLSAYYNNQFSENIIIEFIQKFSKLVLHNITHTKWIFDSIKENNLDNTAYMAILIKH